MKRRSSVYLGSLDIGLRGRLVTSSRVEKTLFAYGLIADKVVLQGSTPLKSQNVYKAYLNLREAFQFDENGQMTPVFSFALSESSENLSEYLEKRSSFLAKLSPLNPESLSYKHSCANETAKSLDQDFIYGHARRKSPVAEIFTRAILSFLESQKSQNLQISELKAASLTKLIRDGKQVQTFELLNHLAAQSHEHRETIFASLREIYNRSNAHANESSAAEHSAFSQRSNLWRFLAALGIDIECYPVELLSPKTLFYLRRLEFLQFLVGFLVRCQSDEDVNETIRLIDFAKKRKFSRMSRTILGALPNPTWFDPTLGVLTQVFKNWLGKEPRFRDDVDEIHQALNELEFRLKRFRRGSV